MKKLFLLLFIVFNSIITFAFPSWIGNQSSSQSVSSQDITFTVWMNQDYFGLSCSVGIYEGTSWTEYPMNYSGNNNGNSVWTLTKSLKTNATLYYFHGTDQNLNNNIYLNNGGNNYTLNINPTTAASGNWSSPESWCDALVPSSTSAKYVIAHDLTLNQDATVGSLSINSGKTFTSNDGTLRTLTLAKSSSGSLTTLGNNGIWSNGSGQSNVVFTGTPGAGDAIHVISGTIPFQNVTMNKTGGSSNVGCSFGTNSSVSGTMEIGVGGFVSTAPPAGFYTSSAILKFNQGSGATYDVNVGDYSWSTTEVPQNITISSGTVNLNANRTATGNLLIDGGTLVLNNNTPTLTINGNWTRTSGSFTPGDGTIVLSGADNKVVNTGSSGSAYNLTISKTGGASVTLENDFTVNNSLTINSGSVLIVNPGTGLTVTGTLTNDAGTAGLVVKADASGFGSLIESNGVNATVESYFSPNRWHFISAPVADLNSGMFEGLYLQEHSETEGFTDVTSLVLPLWPTQGFALWGGTSGGFTKSYIGNLNVSDYNGVGLYRDAGGTDRGWNLIGNPYPSVLDWNAVTKSNVNTAIYIENNGGWAIYNNGAGVPSTSTQYIAPGQGVFVQVTDGGAGSYPNSGTVSITNAARVHNTSTFYKSTEATNLLRLQVSGNTYTDEAVVRFAPDATLEFDGNYDAHKFFAEISGNAQIYTLGSTSLAINALPSETSSVPLGIRTDMAGTYTIAATELLEIPVVALEDTKTGTFTDLISGSYTFTIEPGENELRFMLHFGTTSVPENEKSISSIYSYQQTVYVNLADNTQGDIYIYNLAGQLVTAKESASGNVRIGLNSMGVYMVKVVTEKETLTQKVVIR
jgi:hypothetical protein